MERKILDIMDYLSLGLILLCNRARGYSGRPKALPVLPGDMDKQTPQRCEGEAGNQEKCLIISERIGLLGHLSGKEGFGLHGLLAGVGQEFIIGSTKLIKAERYKRVCNLKTRGQIK